MHDICQNKIKPDPYFLHTDIGHDPDDAIALSYLIEHNWIPGIICVTPGFDQQVQLVQSILNMYGLDRQDVDILKSREQTGVLELGKHKVLLDSTARNDACTVLDYDMICADSALVIGPALNLGDKLSFETLYFQGGYSPNSVKPLEKFIGKKSACSYNPNGAKVDFINLQMAGGKTKCRYYIGKNICHGFTLKQLNWEPKNATMLKFFKQLSPHKKMHDVLAAMMLMNERNGIWEQAEPVFLSNGEMSTLPTERHVYTLIGINEEWFGKF